MNALWQSFTVFHIDDNCSSAPWSKNPDESNGPLLRLLVCLHRSLAHSHTHSLAYGTVNNQMAIFAAFFILFWTIVLRCVEQEKKKNKKNITTKKKQCQ